MSGTGARQRPTREFQVLARRHRASLFWMSIQPSGGISVSMTREGRLYLTGRCLADVLLFGFTVVELALLVSLAATLTFLDTVYFLQHVIVLGIALTRPSATARDFSMLASMSCFVAMAYPYAQLVYLRFVEGHEVSPTAGLVLVTLAAGLSFASLLALGRSFGIRPALRCVVTRGPYRIVRHPMYLSYFVADVGFNLQLYNSGTILLTLAGWAALLYRIRAEEGVLAYADRWAAYLATVRYRLFPGVW